MDLGELDLKIKMNLIKIVLETFWETSLQGGEHLRSKRLFYSIKKQRGTFTPR